MALNKAQRNDLRNTVIKCRRLLEEATSGILEGKFGIQRSGEVEDPSQLFHLSDAELRYREQVASHLLHTQAMGVTARDAVARLVREASYTHLNRPLCLQDVGDKRGAQAGGRTGTRLERSGWPWPQIQRVHVLPRGPSGR